MSSSGMLSRVAIIRTDRLEGPSFPNIRFPRVGELGTLAVIVNRGTLRTNRLLIPANVVPCSPTLHDIHPVQQEGATAALVTFRVLCPAEPAATARAYNVPGSICRGTGAESIPQRSISVLGSRYSSAGNRSSAHRSPSSAEHVKGIQSQKQTNSVALSPRANYTH
jgi:hypothetical protein